LKIIDWINIPSLRGQILANHQSSCKKKAIPINHVEEVVVRSSHDVFIISTPAAFKFIEYAIILI